MCGNRMDLSDKERKWGEALAAARLKAERKKKGKSKKGFCRAAASVSRPACIKVAPVERGGGSVEAWLTAWGRPDSFSFASTELPGL